ncbi:MAG: threonine/serine exporter family protein, partial [Lachnospiraceae bacterium]|nr:threonine/serine exporter family protein [Lachnospiraceae bacterium]
ELIGLSFLASLGFAIIFQVRGKFLLIAGAGGALVRTVYIICQMFIPYRILYAGLAAMAAAIFAEIVSTKKNTPATVFLYPFIIPLIPADLIYYTIGGLILGETNTFVENGIDCLLALLGISIGFVVASTISHYIRKFALSKEGA